jgi:hypothetical protein
MVSSIVRFVLLGMGHPFRDSLIVIYIYTGFTIWHRHTVVVVLVLDCLRLEAFDETLHIALFRPGLRAHKPTHRQRSRGSRFGAVTDVCTRDDLGLSPEANFAGRLIP